MKKNTGIMLLLAAALIVTPAAAQSPPTPPPTANIGGFVSVSVTNSSVAQALPANASPFLAVTLYNSGSNDAYFKTGTSTVVATTSPSGAGAGVVLAGTRMTTWVGPGSTHIAFLTASSTTTVKVFQATGPIEFGVVVPNGGLGAVTSVFSRTGAVVATSGDYTCALVTNCGPLNASNTWSANGALSVPAFSMTGTAITGGTGTTTKPLMLLEPTGTASTAWNTGGTMLGVNSDGTVTNLLDLQQQGSSRFSVTSGGNINLRNTGAFIWSGRSTLSSPGVGGTQLGAADVAAPVAQTLSAQSVVAGTSNTAGQNMAIVGSRSTGSGVSGDVCIQTGGTGAGSTGQNSAVNGLCVKGATQLVQLSKTYTVSTLPTCNAGLQGATTVVTDATAPTWNSALVGSGAVVIKAFCNGSIWVAG